jgi:hypothetical protein
LKEKQKVMCGGVGMAGRISVQDGWRLLLSGIWHCVIRRNMLFPSSGVDNYVPNGVTRYRTIAVLFVTCVRTSDRCVSYGEVKQSKVLHFTKHVYCKTTDYFFRRLFNDPFRVEII